MTVPGHGMYNNVVQAPKSQVIKTYALVLLCSCVFVCICSCATSNLGHQTSRASVVKTAQDVLLDMHFDIEKADFQAGLVRTKPLPGAQFFEFWRSDNVGASNQLMANLQDIRRTAEIIITEQNGQPHIECVVNVQRLSLPGRDIDSAARAYQMFSRSSPLLQTLQLGSTTIAGMDWVSLGRDNLLEEKILKQIDRRIAPRKTEANPSVEG